MQMGIDHCWFVTATAGEIFLHFRYDIISVIFWTSYISLIVEYGIDTSTPLIYIFVLFSVPSLWRQWRYELQLDTLTLFCHFIFVHLEKNWQHWLRPLFSTGGMECPCINSSNDFFCCLFFLKNQGIYYAFSFVCFFPRDWLTKGLKMAATEMTSCCSLR